MPDPEIPAEKTADAVMIPQKFKTGGRLRSRVYSLLDIAEPILKVDRSKGEQAHVRHQPNGMHFVTKNPDDSLQFPKDSERMGEPRYHWVQREDGISLGYLVEGAASYEQPARG